MLSMNVVEPLQNEQIGPTVFILRKERALQVCVDCRKMNAFAIWDTYAIPEREECIESLGQATIFSKLDTTS